MLGRTIVIVLLTLSSMAAEDFINVNATRTGLDVMFALIEALPRVFSVVMIAVNFNGPATPVGMLTFTDETCKPANVSRGVTGNDAAKVSVSREKVDMRNVECIASTEG